jgi:nucleotide-binding universal stress UspA family protein
MSVVCGTDFTEHAAEAATAAAALCVRWGQPLTLVHVREPAAILQLQEESHSAVTAQLDAEVHRLRSLGITVTSEILEGAPDEALVDFASRTTATLIVVGALGRRSGARWSIGSIADRVAQTSRVPVLIVRTAAPFQAWARSERPLRVLVGADFSATADAAIAWVRSLRRLGGCDLRAGHVYRPPHEHARLGIRGPTSLVDAHPEVARVLTGELAARLGMAANGAVDIRIGASCGRIADALLLMAEREATDLLVVGTHQRTGLSKLWHGSISCSVVQAASMAVACVPIPEPPEAPRRELPDVDSVLAPTDFSDLANAAIPHAYAVVDESGTVHLLHVVEMVEPAVQPNPLYAHYVPGRTPTPEERRRQHADLAARLEALIPAGAEARAVRTEVHVIEGQDVAASIEQTAERLQVSLVCLGSHGRSGAARAILGSVASAVIAASHRPVLVVRVPRDPT